MEILASAVDFCTCCSSLLYLLIKDMDDSSEDEISENSDVDMEDSDTINKQGIAHENAMAMWRWKAKCVCLLYLLMKRRRLKALQNSYRPVGRCSYFQ